MRLKRFLLISLIILLISIITSCSAFQSKFTTEQKEEDFLYLYNLLEKEYPFFDIKSRLYKRNWLDNKQEYLEKIANTENDEEFFRKLEYIVYDLHDGHTHIVSPQYYELLRGFIPEDTTTQSSSRNEFFIKPHQSSEDSYKFWSKVLRVDTEKINSTNTNSASRFIDFDTYHNGDTAYVKFSSFAVSQETGQSVYNFIKDNINCSNIIIDIRSNSGGNSTLWLDNIVYPLMNEEYYIEKKLAFRGGEISNQYVDLLLDSYSDIATKKSINELPKGLYYPPELHTDFSYYLDLNYKQESPKPLGFKGDIYVLINRGVYSAAEGFASFCKQTGFATLVGERTLGDGGGTSTILVKLPNSGLLLRMRLEMILNPDGTANAEYGTSPDIEAYSLEALNETLKIIEENRKP